MKILNRFMRDVEIHVSTQISEQFNKSIRDWLMTRLLIYESHPDADEVRCSRDIRLAITCVRYRTLRSLIDTYTRRYENVPEALLLIIRWCIHYSNRYGLELLPSHLPDSSSSRIAWVLLEHLNVLPTDIDIIQRLGSELEDSFGQQVHSEMKTELERELSRISNERIPESRSSGSRRRSVISDR